jgi:NAD(P)-dependent dehydrogenase (short-subunit alcohol dehydrogenase family)
MQRKLEGKIALITGGSGGSRGIGAAIAKRLAADGANVAITYTKGADAAASVVKEIERTGGKAIAIQADAADADASKAAVDKTVATFGHLDVLVNNAGTAISKRFEETTLEELDRVIDINVRGTFVATQAALTLEKRDEPISRTATKPNRVGCIRDLPRFEPNGLRQRSNWERLDICRGIRRNERLGQIFAATA